MLVRTFLTNEISDMKYNNVYIYKSFGIRFLFERSESRNHIPLELFNSHL